MAAAAHKSAKQAATAAISSMAAVRPSNPPESPIGAIELAHRFADSGVAAIVHTDIGRDGTLAGVDAAASAVFARAVGIPVIASGGVASLADLAALKACERDGIEGVICGRALYDGRIDPQAALRLLAASPTC